MPLATQRLGDGVGHGAAIGEQSYCVETRSEEAAVPQDVAGRWVAGMRIQAFDAASMGYGRPAMPLRATRFSCAAWRLVSDAPAQSTEVQEFARARYALRAALSFAGVGPSAAVLMPSYHCRTMLDPVLRLRASVAFYPLTVELQPDLPALEAMIKSHHGSVKALVACHYFGRRTRLEKIRALCDENGIHLIEDCAHVMRLGPTPLLAGDDPTVGAVGDHVIASPSKFFPCNWGGLLWSSTGRNLSPGLARPSFVDGVKEAQSLFGGSSRPGSRPPTHRLQGALELPTSRGMESEDSFEDLVEPAAAYEVHRENQRCPPVSTWITRHTAMGEIAAARRANAEHWMGTLRAISGVRPLFVDASELGVAPYMVPVLIESPQRVFHGLKSMGFPVGRWDALAVSDCEVARRYRLGLFHLPCHQQLSVPDMQWLAQRLIEALDLA